MKIIEKNLPNGAYLKGYLHEALDNGIPRIRPAVIIFPGGGYSVCSLQESDPVAFSFLNRGYQVFILFYPVGKFASDFRPLVAASGVIQWIRLEKETFSIDSEKIAVCGFSAGGHLAGSTGVLWDHPKVQEAVHAPNGENRPNAMILCYPVISCVEFAHSGSRAMVSGSDKPCELWDTFSLEKRVNATTPPTFLWHTVTDPTVPVENSMLFAFAMQKNKRPFECHIFANGGHGLSMCTKQVDTSDPVDAQWFNLCCNWLEKLFDYPYL